MTSNSNISNLGRFSSQMLTYLGTQRTVKLVGGSLANSFKYSSGPVSYPSPGSVSQSYLGGGVVGNYSPTVYNTTKCYFLSRGATEVYADAMTGLAIDTATLLGISTQYLLEKSEIDGKLHFDSNAYTKFNMLRDPGNQVAVVTSVDNRYSLQSREIRA